MVVALPDLGAVAAALLLLLIAAALWVIIQLLVNTLGHAPLIGGWITRDLAGWLNDARNAILGASRATWHAAVDLFNWGNNLTFTALVHTALFMQDATTAISRLLTVRLPQFLGFAYSYALGLYDSAVSYAQALQRQALTWAAGEISALEQRTLALAARAESDIAAGVARAEADIAAGVARAESDAAALVGSASIALRAEISAAEQLAGREVAALEALTQIAVTQLQNDLTIGIQSAEALAYSQVTALGRGIVTDLEQTGDAAIRLAWPDAAGDIDALRQALGADFPWLNDLLGALAGLGTAGLLGALIRSMATSHAMTRLATDCIVPNCRNLSGLSKFLQSLFSDATDLALIAWLAEGIADPGRWAADTQAVLGPIGADTASAARTLLGV